VDAAEAVIRRYIEAVSAPDGDAAAALTADDALIELPGGDVLEGKEGARRFAAKHGENEGQKRSVTLTSLEARTSDRYLAILEMTNRELATDELLYSLDVGSIFDVRDGHIVHQRVFPSAAEAEAAAGRT
jgi:ketosteroid isomerase-like protein